MTPEERRRAMDFVVEQLARFAAAIERERKERREHTQKEREERLQQFRQEREERKRQLQEREARLQQWKMDQPRIARVEAALIKLTELAELQSLRLDQHAQGFQKSLKLYDEAEARGQRRHQEVLGRLDRILERLPQP
jgi:hypothetical protein